MLRTVLYFVGFLYWPLFFIGVRSLYFRCEITGKKLGASLFLAAGAAPLFDAWIRDCSCHIDALARKSTYPKDKDQGNRTFSISLHILADAPRNKFVRRHGRFGSRGSHIYGRKGEKTQGKRCSVKRPHQQTVGVVKFHP